MTRFKLTLLTTVIAFLVIPTERVQAQELEPETGTFADYGPPAPYDLILRRALLEDDHYRLCQFVVLPSFAPEYAVYFVETTEGPPIVISRTLKRQLWSSMMEQMAKAHPNGAITLDAITENSALDQLQTNVETKRAELSASTAATIGAVCRDVILRVRYKKSQTAGMDGTTYHVGHWISGAFLAGQTWSPANGSLPAEFVRLGEKLRAYAEAAPSDRSQAEAALLAQASLVKRIVSRH
jgi:hypothetical protein